jgi:hypothetical protein
LWPAVIAIGVAASTWPISGAHELLNVTAIKQIWSRSCQLTILAPVLIG